MNSTGSYWVLPSFSDFFSWGILGAGPGLPRVQHKGCHGAIETDVGGMKAGRRRQLIAVDFGYVIHVHGNVVFFLSFRRRRRRRRKAIVFIGRWLGPSRTASDISNTIDNDTSATPRAERIGSNLVCRSVRRRPHRYIDAATLVESVECRNVDAMEASTVTVELGGNLLLYVRPDALANSHFRFE